MLDSKGKFIFLMYHEIVDITKILAALTHRWNKIRNIQMAENCKTTKKIWVWFPILHIRKAILDKSKNLQSTHHAPNIANILDCL